MMSAGGNDVMTSANSSLGSDAVLTELTNSEVRKDTRGRLECLDETMDHILTMLHLETNIYAPCEDYMEMIHSRNTQPHEQQHLVNENWRRRLCEWCYNVVDHVDVEREVVAFAFNYFDRYMAAKTAKEPETVVSKREFQLISLTCLYTAMKVHGHKSMDGASSQRKFCLGISDFVKLSRGFFPIDVIQAMERNLLMALNWNVNPPTCESFLVHFLRLFPRSSSDGKDSSHSKANVQGIFETARYLAELSVGVFAFSFTSTNSIIALACICCAIEAKHLPPLPVDARIGFFKNIHQVTGMSPNEEHVKNACRMVRDLYPALFEGDHLPMDLVVVHSGNNSPVSVMDQTNRNENHHRHGQ